MALGYSFAPTAANYIQSPTGGPRPGSASGPQASVQLLNLRLPTRDVANAPVVPELLGNGTPRAPMATGNPVLDAWLGHVFLGATGRQDTPRAPVATAPGFDPGGGTTIDNGSLDRNGYAPTGPYTPAPPPQAAPSLPPAMFAMTPPSNPWGALANVVNTLAQPYTPSPAPAPTAPGPGPTPRVPIAPPIFNFEHGPDTPVLPGPSVDLNPRPNPPGPPPISVPDVPLPTPIDNGLVQIDQPPPVVTSPTARSLFDDGEGFRAWLHGERNLA
jgi:hypothetical protein